VLAAPTMALPEIMGGTLNWDYRYCWLRDAAYILQAFAGVGRAMEAQPFLRWLLHATRMTSPRLATVYDVYGRTLGREQILSRFEGYRGSGPVRLGNAAHGQLQLDVWGSLIRAADHFARHGGKLDVVERRILRDLGEHVCRIWREPDDGIWEKRGPRRHTTYGKAMCWSALDTLLDMARRGLIEVPVDRFAAEADRIRDHVLADGWNSSRRAYTAAFGHDDLDASVLTLPILGIVEATHPRMVATFERIDEELGHGALIDRYAPPNPDRREGSFGICGFWAVEYLVAAGRLAEAEARFDELLSYGNDLGLFAEETDPADGSALGNFPQALTHVGLINAALAIERATAKGVP
jgi:GH15 family glucan-1,4-alpha-glucosidase